MHICRNCFPHFSVILVSIEDRSSSHKYAKVLCDMRKFSIQSCVHIDFTTFSHQWLLLSFVQRILSCDKFKHATDISTTNTNRSIACLLSNSLLRLFLFCFINVNLRTVHTQHKTVTGLWERVNWGVWYASGVHPHCCSHLAVLSTSPLTLETTSER